MEWILALLIGLAGGGGVCYVLLNKLNKSTQTKLIQASNQKSELILEQAKIAAKRITDEAEVNAEKVLSKAEGKNEQIKQKKIQEAKDLFNSKRSEFEKERALHLVEMKEREMITVNTENDLKRRLNDFKSKSEAVESRESELNTLRDNLEKQLKIVSKRKEELDASTEKQIKALESIARLTESEAKEQLIDAIRAKAESESMSYVKDAVEQAKVNANKEAKKIVIQTIQRMASEYTIENTVSVFHLDNDDVKGQIIGREGRNIRALEAATGAEIVVDDTPEAIVISSFDPIRREICRLALQRLVADGRIHPARIEEVVAKVKKQLEEQIREIGERTIIDLDIHGLDPYLVWMVGRMRFRSSYGQNLLKHSIETANLCATMCAELGLNSKLIKLAKRAGLLHDIGKVSEEDSELSHAIIGMKLCEKYNEHPAIINAVGAHHDEIEMNSIISPIIQACDAISGARPGARREILESYLKRIGELEDLALSYEGVQKAYALQAGRELRVIVESDKVSDGFADELAFLISQRIEKEMQYPGQVRVTVIREKRATSIAR